jgi:hypothetical protein
MYKAKCNIACGQRYFVAGREYTKKEIEGLDVNDFENVGKEVVEKEVVVEESTIEEEVVVEKEAKPKKSKK